MKEDDAPLGDPHGLGSEHEILLLQREKLGADEACGRHPAGDADDNHDVVNAGREQRDHGQNQKEGGKAQHHVGKAHDQVIDAQAQETRRAVVSGDAAEHHADGHGDTHGDEADGKRNEAALKHARKHVPTELVGSK